MNLISDLKFIIHSYLDLEEILLCFKDTPHRKRLLRCISLPDIDVEASKGHLDAVRYLWKLGTRMTNKAIDLASSDGNLTMVMYWRDRGRSYTRNAIHNAIINNHIEILKYFHNDIFGYHYYYKSMLQAYNIILAIKYNRLEIIKYFVETRVEITKRVIETAFKFGNIDIIKYLCPSDTSYHNKMSDATLRNDLAIIRYLCELNILPTIQHLNLAVHHGYTEVVKFFLVSGIKPRMSTLRLARKHSNILNLLKFNLSCIV